MSDTVTKFFKALIDIVNDTLIKLSDLLNIHIGNRVYLVLILVGLLLILTGCYVSVYKNSVLFKTGNISYKGSSRYLKFFEAITKKYPLKIISQKLNQSLSYFMLSELVQSKLVVFLSLFLPTAGILIYIPMMGVLNLWYVRLIIFLLCFMVPYYVFTLIVDYMKYSLRLKIPALIDSFRSSFMTNYRIKPSLMECSRNIDKSLGRIIYRASDCSDLNDSLCKMRDRINDTWFNIFVLLLVNYRENGGELIAQLYKLNRTITRYNNIEKKKNKRLIWYEIFTVAASIFSLPVIVLVNNIILGMNSGLYYNSTSSFAKIAIFSLCALLVVRILRRMS